MNVADYNIEIGDGSDSHARAAMDALMAINPRPQVIVIEEGWTSLFNTYIDELQRQTGQTWHGAWGMMCDPGAGAKALHALAAGGDSTLALTAQSALHHCGGR